MSLRIVAIRGDRSPLNHRPITLRATPLRQARSLVVQLRRCSSACTALAISSMATSSSILPAGVRPQVSIRHIHRAGDVVLTCRRHRSPILNALAFAGTTGVVSSRSASGEPKTRLVDPDQDGAMLFPWSPPRVTFRNDRDAVGIEAKDRRGRGFSPHSARKFFETTLIDAGIQERVVDRLMRHSGGVQARYYDTELKILSEAVKKVPNLWPGAELRTEVSGGQHVDKFTQASASAKDGLLEGRNRGTFLPATSATPATDSSRPPAPGAPWLMSQLTVPSWAAGHAESSEPVPLRSPPAGSIHDSDPGMPILGQINADRTAMAALLEAVARLLRESADGRQAAPGRTA